MPDGIIPSGYDPAVEFAGALRQAVQESGLTLERIRHRLGQRGLTISVATLSYWQRGRSRPRSRPVVTTLEEVLRVPAGTLTELLDDPAPAAAPAPGAPGRGAAARGAVARGAPAGGPGRPGAAALWPDPAGYSRLVAQLDRSGDHRLERLSRHDVFLLGLDRCPLTLTVREVLRATGDDVDRVVCVHPATAGPGQPEIGGLRYCRPGRIRAEGGLLGFELVLDRVLTAGDTAVVEYELRLPAGGPVHLDYQRPFPRPVRDYLAVVQFHEDMFPARCYGFSREAGDAPRRRAAELWIGTSGSAHLAVGDVRQGILGIEWEWD